MRGRISDALDTLQRWQAFWAAWEWAKPYLLNKVSFAAAVALVSGYLAAFEHVRPWQIWLATLYGVAGALLIVAAWRKARAADASPMAATEDPADRIPRIFERYFLKVTSLRERLRDCASDDDVYAVRVRLSELRGELLNMADKRIARDVAKQFRAPNDRDALRVQFGGNVRKEVAFLIDDLADQIYRQWTVAAIVHTEHRNPHH